jgi:3-hydroxymyristoyl/3-hydroxydecanoyl-(acyl carrier protein) dehydratase
LQPPRRRQAGVIAAAGERDAAERNAPADRAATAIPPFVAPVYAAGLVRYLLLDRITALEPPELARAVKCVSLSDDVFVDHFPGHPVLPGALILEGLAQLAGVLLEATLRQKGRSDLHALLTMVDRAKFRHMVRPGDRLELEARGVMATEDGGRARAAAHLGDQTVAEAELGFAFARVSNPKVIERRREVLNVWLTGSAEEP